ncbi:unnamed protein product [Blepharisma stoltei]|uniref:Uncharacterized protein n=1 Tax=Blepharisma stoltei TaxID=1481888 RepID=A0AAU9JNA0_9CILI|nr:unnamed protein product [Blepharisma stoltei]
MGREIGSELRKSESYNRLEEYLPESISNLKLSHNLLGNYTIIRNKLELELSAKTSTLICNLPFYLYREMLLFQALLEKGGFLIHTQGMWTPYETFYLLGLWTLNWQKWFLKIKMHTLII